MRRLVMFGLLLLPAAASATINMSGPWRLRTFSLLGGIWTFAQNGTELTATPPLSSPPFTGGIDSTTGAFAVSGYIACGSVQDAISGTVATDGSTFTGSASVHIPHCTITCECSETTDAVVGTRCGNGQLDPGEECDDGNDIDGDCCSSTCRLDAPGTTCQTDDDVCTDDVCDGVGTCIHVPNTASCNSACRTDAHCVDGQCIGTPRAAGAPCDVDGNFCTDDRCDGNGSCAAGGPRYCGPCGSSCDASYSICMGPPATTCAATHTARAVVDMRLPRTGHPDSFRWTWIEDAGGTELPDFGDPLATAGYTLCVYDGFNSGPFFGKHVLAQVSIPPGGVCGGRPCWKQIRDGFRYAQRGHAVRGFKSIKLRAPAQTPARIQMRGSDVGLSTTLGAIYAFVDVQLVGGAACWTATYPDVVPPSDRFRARP
jgi:cysteine-rich repeat protein